LVAFGTNLEFIFLDIPDVFCKKTKSMQAKLSFLSGENIRDSSGNKNEGASSKA
jgi:hypothetical protein